MIPIAKLGDKKFACLGGKSLRDLAEQQRARESIAAASDVAGRDVHLERLEAQDLDLHLSRCGVPSAYAVAVRNLERSPTVALVAEWHASTGSVLVLHGDPQNGKTVAACSVFRLERRRISWQGGDQVEYDSISCAFERAIELSRLGYFGRDTIRYLDHLASVKLLVLDDLGAELMTEAWHSTLDGLITERLSNTQCRTIITTNLRCTRRSSDLDPVTGQPRPSPFQLRYGDRIGARLRTNGRFALVAGWRPGTTKALESSSEEEETERAQ